MLAIQVELRFGVYDAALSWDPKAPEWPPHPARVFCALVASSPDADEWAALKWLESQPPPEVRCAPELQAWGHTQYLITNEVTAGSPTLPGRIAKARIKPAVAVANSRFAVVYPDADPDAAVLAALTALARRVPYLGRSTSHALLTVSRELAHESDWRVWIPADRDEMEAQLTVPYPGYSDLLEQVFLAGGSAWEVSRRVPYTAILPQSRDDMPEDEGNGATAPFPARYRLLILEGDVDRFYVQHTAKICEMLRSATLARVSDPLPNQLAGHDDTIDHVAFLTLPTVGTPSELPGAMDVEIVRPQPHGDGHLLGLALAIPVSMPDDDVRAIVRGLSGRWNLDVPDGLRHIVGSSIALERQVTAPRAFGASLPRWTAPSRFWATATPVVFDQFPAGRSESEMVSRALVRAGYPEPIRVGTQRSPILPGSAAHSPSSVLRRAGVRAKPFTHAWVEFEREVVGPVIAGSMRFRGLGLFAPVRTRPRGVAKSDGVEARAEAVDTP